MTLVTERYNLGRSRLLEFLSGLGGNAPGPSLTVYFKPDSPPDEIEDILESSPVPAGAHIEISKHSGNSPTGAVLFCSNEKLSLVLPPFPVGEQLIFNTLETEPLRSTLSRDQRIGLVLVRLGSYAIGACQGETLMTSKVGTGLVHGRHRQGGSSAHRFERHRDKQIEYFLTRVCRHIREQLEPYVKQLDFLVYGGARTTIILLQKQCPFLARLTAPTLPPLLDIPEPRRPVLEAAVRRVWSGAVIEWKEN